MTTTEFDWTGVIDYSKRTVLEPPKTQYELPGVTTEDHLGVPAAVVPLWHAVVTARINVPAGDHAALAEAQRRLNTALEEVERAYPLGPTGLFAQISYGLSYFHDHIPSKLTDEHMPKSTMAGTEGQWAVVDSIRFEKDPEDLVLEQHDIAFHLKSDYKDHIDRVIDALFSPGEQLLNGIPAERVYLGDLFTVTTTRYGFAGHGMPRIMAQRMGIPGADDVPAGAMLFMGFTSSHVHGLAQGNLASFETIPGYTDCGVDDYFAGGTSMHLSHIAINLDQWYAMGHKDRLHRMFNSRRNEEPDVLSPDQSPATSTFEEQRDKDAEGSGVVGHNAQMQFLSRVKEDTTTAYGEKLEKGTVFFLRQDFDTVENPFRFSTTDRIDSRGRAGVHFIGFGPSAQHFEKMRKEMDGMDLQKRYNLPEENAGFTKFLVTTHRQNMVLPPRAHRSFPLAELL
ncbi:MAG TPA: hypothetical protein VFL99_01820 [Segeticoccus sp.]|uniref:DUF7405 family protein n=1 Tax=Segeticoccus sp. TaxID=2706531 RepID=UPI002D7F54DA|nr:hypothetical protein [Segeticoccus sp.]HET8599033.1 hypothetical protein [Segeticoccus sp.]